MYLFRKFDIRSMIHSTSNRDSNSSSEDKCFLVGRLYKLKRKVGSGSFGEIYLATDIQTSQEVAVKLESVKVSSCYHNIIFYNHSY